jgi:hypothetical protein
MAVDTKEMADQLREMGNAEFDDSNDAHDRLLNFHQVASALQDALKALGEQVRQAPGITDEYAEIAEEAASVVGGVADELESELRGIVDA